MGSVACRSVDNLRRFLVLALLIAVGAQTSWAEDESGKHRVEILSRGCSDF